MQPDTALALYCILCIWPMLCTWETYFVHNCVGYFGTFFTFSIQTYHLQFHLKQSHSVVHSMTQLALPARPSPMSSNKSHSAGLTQPVLFAKSLLSFHLISNFKPNIFSTNLFSSHIILQASLSYNAHCVYPICSKSLFFAISFCLLE